MEDIAIVGVSKVYVSAPATTGGLDDCTLVVAGMVVEFTVATGGGSTILAGWVTGMTSIAQKGGGIVRQVQVQIGLVVTNNQLGQTQGSEKVVFKQGNYYC